MRRPSEKSTGKRRQKCQHDNRPIIVVNLLFCCRKIASNSFQESKNEESDNVERKKLIAIRKVPTKANAPQNPISILATIAQVKLSDNANNKQAIET